MAVDFSLLIPDVLLIYINPIHLIHSLSLAGVSSVYSYTGGCPSREENNFLSVQIEERAAD